MFLRILYTQQIKNRKISGDTVANHETKNWLMDADGSIILDAASMGGGNLHDASN